MAAIELALASGTAFAHAADFLRDTLLISFDGNRSKAITIPFIWSVATTPSDVVSGVEAYIANEGLSVAGNGHGLIVETGSSSHPTAEITGQDFDVNLMEFRWVNGPYTGDCAISFDFTLTTEVSDLVNAILEIVPS